MNELKDIFSYLDVSGVLQKVILDGGDTINLKKVLKDMVDDNKLSTKVNLEHINYSVLDDIVGNTKKQVTEEVDDSIVEKLNGLKVLLNTLKICIDSGVEGSVDYVDYESVVTYYEDDVNAMKDTVKKALTIVDKVLKRIKVY